MLCVDTGLRGMAWGVKLLDLRRCKLVKQQAGFEMGRDEVKGEKKGEEDK